MLYSFSNITIVIDMMQNDKQHGATNFHYSQAVKLYFVKKAIPRIIDVFWTMRNLKSKKEFFIQGSYTMDLQYL